MAIRRRTLVVALAALALAGALAAGWQAGKAALLQWALARAVEASGGRLAVEGVAGTLFDGVNVRRLAWTQRPGGGGGPRGGGSGGIGGTGIGGTAGGGTAGGGSSGTGARPPDDAGFALELADVRVRWSAGSLLSREVDVVRLSAASLRVRVPSGGEASEPPADLAVPIAWRVRALEVASIAIERPGAAPIALRDLSAAVSYGEGRYRVDGFSVAGDWGRARAQGTLGDAAPFPLAVQARATLAWRALAIDATASGTLAAIDVAATARAGTPGSPPGAAPPTNSGGAPADPASARLGTRVRPFDAQPLAPVDLALEHVDAGWLGLPDGWRASLAGSVRATPAASASDPPWSLRVDATNSQPGPLDARALPFDRLRATLLWRGERWEARDLRATTPGGGGVRGTASLDTGAKVDLLGRAIPRVELDLAAEALDLARLSAALPATRIAGRARAGGARFDVDLADASREGVALAARGTLDGQTLRIESARARSLPGMPGARLDVAGSAGLRAPFDADLAGEFERLDPSALALLARRWLPQVAAARQRASEPAPSSPAGAAADASGPLDALARVHASLDGRWRVRGPLRLAAGAALDASLEVERGTLAGLPIRAALDGRFQAGRAERVTLDLALADARLRASGAFGAPDDRLALRADVPALARIAPLLGAPGVAGALEVDATLRGRADAPGVDARANVRALALPGDVTVRSAALSLTLPQLAGRWSDARVSAHVDARELRVRGTAFDALAFDADGSASAHAFRARLDGARLRASAAGSAALAPGPSWSATLRELGLEGTVGARLARPATIELSPAGARVGALSIVSDHGEVNLARASWRDGRAELAGDARVERVARLAAAFGVALPGADEAVLDALALELSADVAGSSADDASGTLALRLRGAPSGAQGRAELQLREGRLSGPVSLDLGTLAFANRLVGPQWALGGRLRFAGRAAGTLAAPRLQGEVSGDGLRLEQRAMGWRLGAGTLAGRFDGETFRLDALTLHDLQGVDARAGGSIELSGEVRVADRDGRFRLAARKLRVPIGPGQRVVLSGDTEVTSRGGAFEIRGRLAADEGLIELRGGEAPSLPDDVVVVDRARGNGASAPALANGRAAEQRFRIGTDLELDLGQKLRVRGSGVDALLGGTVTLRGALPDAPRAFGTVRVREGSYAAYGQRLEITRGRLVFNGALDNPVLDIVALRRNQAVEAGVALTGTVLSPRVRLTSQPEVPDSEKLSWLVLGVPLDAAQSSAQGAALQAAAASLFGRNDGTMSGGIAGALGLDSIGIRSSSGASDGLLVPSLGGGGFGGTLPAVPGQVGGGLQAPGSTTAAQSVVSVGKRLSSRVMVTYEQGLRGVWNLLRIQYDISRRLSVRAQTGSESALDLLYRFSFD